MAIHFQNNIYSQHLLQSIFFSNLNRFTNYYYYHFER